VLHPTLFVYTIKQGLLALLLLLLLLLFLLLTVFPCPPCCSQGPLQPTAALGPCCTNISFGTLLTAAAAAAT
jgi:hypothetical protein